MAKLSVVRRITGLKHPSHHFRMPTLAVALGRYSHVIEYFGDSSETKALLMKLSYDRYDFLFGLMSYQNVVVKMLSITRLRRVAVMMMCFSNDVFLMEEKLISK
jgi:hypothetical protein